MAVSTRALKPASEKRQGTKSREVKHQWCSAPYREPRFWIGTPVLQERDVPLEIDTIITCWHRS